MQLSYEQPMNMPSTDSDFHWMKQDVRNGLLARIARTEVEVRAAQRLRYQVFFEELGAKPSAENRDLMLDRDAFDAVCDHVLVIDQHNLSYTDGTELPEGRLVGTYRLLTHDRAQHGSGFYSANEFDVASLLAAHPNLRFLEAGRSCVAASHRGKAVAELLWQGIWDYVRAHKLDVMFGCASLPGTDPERLAHELSYLHHHARAPADWRVNALPGRAVNMNLLPDEAIDKRRLIQSLPILIKAYLRLGAIVGEEAVIDRDFNTTDVLIMLPVSRINPKYFGHYGAPD
jgi:L-ornithine Nalpha-acyltransferase